MLKKCPIAKSNVVSLSWCWFMVSICVFQRSLWLKLKYILLMVEERVNLSLDTLFTRVPCQLQRLPLGNVMNPYLLIHTI